MDTSIERPNSLLDLPFELRSKIYKSCFREENDIWPNGIESAFWNPYGQNHVQKCRSDCCETRPQGLWVLGKYVHLLRHGPGEQRVERDAYCEEMILGEESWNSIHPALFSEKCIEGIWWHGPGIDLPFAGRNLVDALDLLSQNHQVETIEFSFIGDQPMLYCTQFFFAGFSLQAVRQLAKVTGVKKLIVSPMPATQTAITNVDLLGQLMTGKPVNLPSLRALNRRSRGGIFPTGLDAIIKFLDSDAEIANSDKISMEIVRETVDEEDDNVKPSPSLQGTASFETDAPNSVSPGGFYRLMHAIRDNYWMWERCQQ